MMGNDRPKATSPAAAAVRSAGTSCAAVATGAAISEVCEGALMSQTFSTSGLPRMPDGMKIRVIARIMNAATSL
jgi:hypothetical protein